VHSSFFMFASGVTMCCNYSQPKGAVGEIAPP